MVNPLLEHLYPITSEMVFINNNIEAVTEAYYDWLVNIYKEKEAKITKE